MAFLSYLQDMTSLALKWKLETTASLWSFNMNVAILKVQLEKVSFLRVSNVSDVVQKSVTQLNESGMLVEKSNIPKNVLWVLLTGDKGGKSTKLLLQFLNCKEQHSVHTARLLAIYEGDKDNYECIEKVFGPVIDETKRVLANISELDLRVDLSQVS